MSGESREKTELPTPKKERDARQKGQVARSQEVVTTVSLFAVIAYIWSTWDSTYLKLVGLFDQMAVLATGDLRNNTYTAIDIAYRDGVSLMLPIIGVTI